MDGIKKRAILFAVLFLAGSAGYFYDSITPLDEISGLRMLMLIGSCAAFMTGALGLVWVVGQFWKAPIDASGLTREQIDQHGRCSFVWRWAAKVTFTLSPVIVIVAADDYRKGGLGSAILLSAFLFCVVVISGYALGDNLWTRHKSEEASRIDGTRPSMEE